MGRSQIAGFGSIGLLPLPPLPVMLYIHVLRGGSFDLIHPLKLHFVELHCYNDFGVLIIKD